VHSYQQEHIQGKVTVPQGMRSLQRVRAQPSSPVDSQRSAKRRCLTASTSTSDFNDADIAEMLLGLSHSPSRCSQAEIYPDFEFFSFPASEWRGIDAFSKPWWYATCGSPYLPTNPQHALSGP